MLLALPYIQENYFVSANNFDPAQGYGMLILTRFHCWFYEKKFTESKMSKSILFAEVKGHDFTFATTHFEPFTDQASVRKLQLQETINYAKQIDKIVVAGVFNFDSNSEE